MNPIKISEKLPQNLVNVFIKHTVAYQPFWTIAYRNGDEFVVMTWSGSEVISIDFVEEWMPLPNHWK